MISEWTLYKWNNLSARVYDGDPYHPECLAEMRTGAPGGPDEDFRPAVEIEEEEVGIDFAGNFDGTVCAYCEECIGDSPPERDEDEDEEEDDEEEDEEEEELR